MTKIYLEYEKIERKPQRHQICNTFHFKIEEVFETPETEYVYTSIAHYSTMIEPIFNRNFGFTFNHQNGPNKLQKVYKHTGQQFQPIYFQISRNF